jgi:hypothetical protein
MSIGPTEAKNPGEYDIEYETVASRTMLEKRIPAELNKVKLAIVDIDRARSWEPLRLALTVDLVDGIERNCEQLLETMSKDRLPAVAWCQGRNKSRPPRRRKRGPLRRREAAPGRGAIARPQVVCCGW